MLRQIMACKMMMEVGVVIVMKKMWTTMMIQLGKFAKVQLKLLMPLFPLVLKL